MKLSELIAAYGDDKVQFQNLDQSLLNLNMHKGVSRITFGTEQPVNMSGPNKLGLIVWLDRDRVAEIVKTGQDRPTNG